MQQLPLPLSRIESVTFRVLTDEQSRNMATVHISNSNLASDDIGGLFDPHLGSLSDQKLCLSCYNTKKLCQGHSGYLQLKYAYIIPQFQQFVKSLLRKICLTEACYGKIIGSGKKCPTCKVYSPVIKELKGMIAILQHGNKKITLTPGNIKNIFNKIDLNTAKKELNIGIFPADLISNNVFIASPIIRPDKRVQSQFKNNDEFTISLQNIVQQGIKLNSMNENNPMFPKLYDTFCQQISNYHKGESESQTGGGQKSQQKKSLSSEMMEKQGQIRGNILGKKTRKIGRAVIACDSTNSPDIVTIPLEFAMTVFVKETIRDYNINRLQKAFNNGPNQYPGANFVQKPNGKQYHVGNVNVVLEKGDILFRHLQNGDYVLLNRQPSLLPSSICTHKIKVSQNPQTYTMDLNVIACPLYNADLTILSSESRSEQQAAFIVMCSL